MFFNNEQEIWLMTDQFEHLEIINKEEQRKWEQHTKENKEKWETKEEWHIDSQIWDDICDREQKWRGTWTTYQEPGETQVFLEMIAKVRTWMRNNGHIENIKYLEFLIQDYNAEEIPEENKDILFDIFLEAACTYKDEEDENWTEEIDMDNN